MFSRSNYLPKKAMTSETLVISIIYKALDYQKSKKGFLLGVWAFFLLVWLKVL